MIASHHVIGAVEKTRTSTGYYPTATSTLRVYQFRHDRELEVGTIKSGANLQGLCRVYLDILADMDAAFGFIGPGPTTRAIIPIPLNPARTGHTAN